MPFVLWCPVSLVVKPCFVGGSAVSVEAWNRFALPGTEAWLDVEYVETCGRVSWLSELVE